MDEDEERPRCKVQLLCFMPVSPDVDRTEFRRQLKLQERALNAMTPGEMLGNRGAYLANPEGMRKLSEPLQARTRAEYRSSKIREYNRLYGSDGRKMLDAHMGTVAALHNPDMIAGGLYTSVADQSIPLQDRIGGLNENSSIGSQWRGGRSQRLTSHAMEQQRNGCPSVQVILEVCVDRGR
ncbi:polymorphic toxin type 15 domain-containing protein [uncultured Paracoccus sp.]|uniref:polymorphic toxin type 15 domain-containing protein n=1 Tax=uncultured Paracoccus sp. TaxID=189685 RepID=UPI002592693C|nr:polymorphic toxin type 15 domain-containing protein [uncultured Paracoccus sp.]